VKQQISTGTAIIIIVVVLLVVGAIVWKALDSGGGGGGKLKIEQAPSALEQQKAGETGDE
jgi:hypothetical protein